MTDKIERLERRRMPTGSSLTVAWHAVKGGHPKHWHRYFEIEIIASGGGKYIINDVEYDISANNVFFLNPTDFHYLAVDETTRLINISFDHTMLDDQDLALLISERNHRAYMLDSADYERLLHAANLLLYEYETAGDCQKQMLQYVVKCLLRKNAMTAEERRVARKTAGSKGRSFIWKCILRKK